MYAIDPPPTSASVELESSILKVLAWFDLFHYPLPAGEIRFFLDRMISAEELKVSLQQLVNDKMIFLHEDCYSLENDPALVVRRTRGNVRASRMLRTAHRIGRLLYHFPFVRGICISGSLSKNFADEKADIDFFIVTRANRLWIARTAMHLFKKITYLWGGQHWFCMNYYIDEDALEIREQNYFTAIELITLMPVCGERAIGQLLSENNWAARYFPRYTEKKPLHGDATKRYGVKRLLERLFNNRLGDRLDEYLFALTSRRWKQKEEKYRLNIKGERMGLDTGKHFSKPNPSFFHKSILEKYDQKLETVSANRERLQSTHFALPVAGTDAQPMFIVDEPRRAIQ
ncbi:hypothetical protein D3H65_17630 [Paraflavitalea soli]|uniref:Nucleotidyltransferase domain-containing protein n=1 Tax=Paraflavitalea soli TaxID=2315862 RepID=A0A3B7MPH2_9BACT|nr:hypothetical protein [Paraflavitalea soli]AXY75687.1 hypothetical protein D3H65_17630 [Paraflavitalea soli]